MTSKIIFIIAALCMTLIHASEIIIRPATEQDIPALSNLSHKAYQNDLKPLWKNNYALLTPSHQTIDEFITEKEHKRNKENTYFITQQKNNNDYCLLLAAIQNKDKTENIAGFCQFKKKDVKSMCIGYIFIDEQFRKQGIAKKLIQTAHQKWDAVTTCKFYLLIHHPLNKSTITKKTGCKRTRALTYDFSTNTITCDPCAPKTHYEYTYTIQK